MRYKQAVIEYSMKQGVTKAAIRYKTSRQNIYRWKKKYTGDIHSLADRTYRLHRHPKQHTEAEREYAPKEHARRSGSILGQTSPTWIH